MFAPIFIPCLLFKKTAAIFHKWLNYGLSTLFSGIMLGVMADICMDLIANVSIVAAVAEIGEVVGVDALKAGMTGIMQSATQQLGLGLLLSILLVTVPPMAGAYFNGLMAAYSPYSVFAGWNNSNSNTAANAVLPPSVANGRGVNNSDTTQHNSASNTSTHISTMGARVTIPSQNNVQPQTHSSSIVGVGKKR